MHLGLNITYIVWRVGWVGRCRSRGRVCRQSAAASRERAAQPSRAQSEQSRAEQSRAEALTQCEWSGHRPSATAVLLLYYLLCAAAAICQCRRCPPCEGVVCGAALSRSPRASATAMLLLIVPLRHLQH
ncbi:hypothetical protein LSTR_LSTR004285 [Laodelphax striatellus]|uniref:Uncharacterized protein n=1 Tax=Laodelphax striatellus TaxID=195883 RepID=A0A482WHB3_LAOST|nr:hypothetical protein LSTR_LSTR004285 [Laodelphax striatellus]